MLGTWRRGARTAGGAGSLTCKREGRKGAGEGNQEQQQLDLHGWRVVDDVSPSSAALDCSGGGGWWYECVRAVAAGRSGEGRERGQRARHEWPFTHARHAPTRFLTDS